LKNHLLLIKQSKQVCLLVCEILRISHSILRTQFTIMKMRITLLETLRLD